MSRRIRVGIPAAILVIAIIAAVVVWRRAREARPAALLGRLPAADALILSIDFEALRRSGMLQAFGGAKVAEEAEYTAFVRRTGFDYQRDLDFAAASFTPRGKYFLLRGRFDWNAIRAYAAAEGGSCSGSICRMTGSAPDRQISFFPLQSDIMAMAVSTDSSAVEALRTRAGTASQPLPDAPIWISIPQSALRTGESLPTGARMFARGMEKAESVILSFAADGPRFAARLDIRCRTNEDAAAIAEQLNRTTTLLRNLIARENQTPNPGDLSGVLTSGSFRSEGARVRGYWPIERAFVDNLLASGKS